MLTTTFDIRRSSKAYIETPEHFIVVWDGIVYLRVIGHEGSYAVMTATAGEDEGHFSAYSDQNALNYAAVLASAQMQLESSTKTDIHDRPYVEICKCEFLSDAYRAAELFFGELAKHQVRGSAAEG